MGRTRCLALCIWLITAAGPAFAIDAREVNRVDYADGVPGEPGVFRRVGVERWVRDVGPRQTAFAEVGRDTENVYLLDVAHRLFVRLDLPRRQVFIQEGRYGQERPEFRILGVYAINPKNLTWAAYGGPGGREGGRFERHGEHWIEQRNGQHPREWRDRGHDESAVFLDGADGRLSVRLDLYRMEMTRARTGDPASLERLPILEIGGPPLTGPQSSPST